jgi:hypothetical protein
MIIIFIVHSTGAAYRAVAIVSPASRAAFLVVDS